MYRLRLGLFSCLLIFVIVAARVAFAQSADNDASLKVEAPDLQPDYYGVTIEDPFVDMHTGPSDGYPVFHVVERGEAVHVIRRKTSWFKIETRDGKTGWVSRDQMAQTLLPSGESFKLVDPDAADFAKRKWSVGVTGGELDSAPVFTFFGGYAFTENLTAELQFGQSIGTSSSSRFYKGDVMLQPFPDWSFSPYLALGIGRVDVRTSSTLITANSETNNFAQVGIGLQTFVSRSFLFRIEANEYVVFSTTNNTNDNEVLNEWKFGFGVFF